MRHAGWLGLILTSVVVTFFSYPPFTFGLVMFVGLIPLFVALETAPSARAAMFRCWLYVFLGNSAICWWIAFSVHEFGQLPWAMSYPFVFVLSAFEQGAWPVVAGLRHVLHRRYGVRPLLWTPAALMVLDAAWPKLFPNTMGNVFYAVPPLRQAADLTGVWGLTALIVATNELGAALVLRSWPRRELIRHGIATAVIVAAAFTYGAWRLARVHEVMRSPESTVKMALIQPNIGSGLKVMAEKGTGEGFLQILRKLEQLSQSTLAQKPAVVIWPETAYPTTYHSTSRHENPEATAVLDTVVEHLGVPLFTGGYDADGNGVDEDRARYNTAFLLTPYGPHTAVPLDPAPTPDIQRYHKSILLKPSEQIPYLQDIGWVRSAILSAGGGAFTPGPGPTILSLKTAQGKLRLGPLICLEGLYPAFSRALVDLGAQVFINLTNDSWFGPGMEPELHLQLTAFRAVETRHPIVRATNTGHTAVIDIDGSFRFETELDREDASVVDVPIYPYSVRSPFQTIGNWFFVVVGLAAAAVFFLARRRKTRLRRD